MGMPREQWERVKNLYGTALERKATHAVGLEVKGAMRWLGSQRPHFAAETSGGNIGTSIPNFNSSQFFTLICQVKDPGFIPGLPHDL
jgi:hypothetical protein